MSLDIFATFATDENLENNGTWFPIGKDAELLIARSGNPNYGKKLTSLFERYENVLKHRDAAADAKSEEIMIEVLATTILLGWKGVSFQKQPLEYSLANAKKLLAVREFRKLVVKLSEDFESFKVKEEAEQGEA